MHSAALEGYIVCAAMDGKAANMPEELLHEREYTRTGVAPAGSSIALVDMVAEDGADEDAAAAKKGSDAELGQAATQNGHTEGTAVCLLLCLGICPPDGFVIFLDTNGRAL